MKNSTSIYYSELAKLRWGQRDAPPIVGTDMHNKLKAFAQAAGKEGGKRHSAARYRAFKRGNEVRWRLYKDHSGRTL